MFASALRRRGFALTAGVATVALTTTAFAATYNYVNWTAADVAGGTAATTPLAPPLRSRPGSGRVEAASERERELQVLRVHGVAYPRRYFAGG